MFYNRYEYRVAYRVYFLQKMNELVTEKTQIDLVTSLLILLFLHTHIHQNIRTVNIFILTKSSGDVTTCAFPVHTGLIK